MPLPPVVCTNPTVHDPSCQCGTTGNKTYPPEGERPEKVHTPRPRSERWVYAENARYRKVLNRVAVELARIDRDADEATLAVTARLHAILREAKQEGANR